MNNFYVYAYLDPRKPGVFTYEDFRFDYEPIYIGKGKNNRKNVHVQKEKRKGKHPFYDKIRKILSTNKEPLITTIIENVSEEESLELEKKLVEIIGRVNLGNGPLLNLMEGGIKNPSLSGVFSPTWKKPFFEFWEIKYGEEEANKKLIEYKKNMSFIKKGTKHKKETKEKISLKTKKRWEAMDDESREKLLKNLLMTEDRKLKASLMLAKKNKEMTGSKHPKSRKVYVEGIEYNSINEVCKKYGFKNHNTVRYRLLSNNFPNWYYIE